jgi:hypothetical protein
MRALKRLQHKDWSELRDLWLGHLPAIDFDTTFPEPTLDQLPRLRHPELNASGLAEVPYADGWREAVFREAILLARKFIYCGSLLPALCNEGRTTWMAIAAYEAAFYGAKSFVYLLGFAPLHRDSKNYVDAFYETKRRQGREKIKTYDTLMIHGLADRLTHEVLWALVVRLLDTTKFDGECQEIQTEMKMLDWDRFQAFRNRVYYECSFWPMSEQIADCDIARPVNNAQMSTTAFLDDTAAAPFAEEYFAAARLLHRLIGSMLASIATNAPALQTEVRAFEILRRPRAAVAAQMA